MKNKGLNFIQNELLIFISLIPFFLVIDRTIRTGPSLNLKIIIYASIICLISAFIITFLINWKQIFNKYSGIIGACLHTVGLIIWLFRADLFAIYLIGTIFTLFNMLPKAHEWTQKTNHNPSSWSKILYFQIISFMGLSINFIILVYFWYNYYFIIFFSISLGIIIILSTFLPFILRQNPQNTIAEEQIVVTPSLNRFYKIKHFFFIMILGFIPIIVSLVLFILFRGLIVFIPIDFSSGKILSAIILGVITLILSLLYRKKY